MPTQPNEYSLMDTGTRFKHMGELLDIWTAALAVMENFLPQYQNKEEFMMQYYKLKAARQVLKKQIEVMGGFGMETEVDRIESAYKK